MLNVLKIGYGISRINGTASGNGFGFVKHAFDQAGFSAMRMAQQDDIPDVFGILAHKSNVLLVKNSCYKLSVLKLFANDLRILILYKKQNIVFQ